MPKKLLVARTVEALGHFGLFFKETIYAAISSSAVRLRANFAIFGSGDSSKCAKLSPLMLDDCAILVKGGTPGMELCWSDVTR